MLREKLDGKAAKDIDAAHKSIRLLSSESKQLHSKLFEKRWKDWMATAVVLVEPGIEEEGLELHARTLQKSLTAVFDSASRRRDDFLISER